MNAAERKRSAHRRPVEQPLRLKAQEVRAILDGSLTELRCIAKPQPSEWGGTDDLVHEPTHPAHYLDSYCNALHTKANPRAMSRHWCWWTRDDRQGPDWLLCPYGKPSDMLWVRETWQEVCTRIGGEFVDLPHYRATDPHPKHYRWRQSNHMPKRLARIWLRVIEVKLEREGSGPWWWVARVKVEEPDSCHKCGATELLEHDTKPGRFICSGCIPFGRRP